MRHKVRSPLAEKFWDGIKTNFGYAEVFQNPTGRELRSIYPTNVGILVTQKAAFFWDREVALHARVISELKLRGCLPLLADFDKGFDSYDAYVSDTVKGTEFDHNPHIREFLEDHPYMGRFELGRLDYYNASQVGDWADLRDEEDEDPWADEPAGAEDFLALYPQY